MSIFRNQATLAGWYVLGTGKLLHLRILHHWEITFVYPAMRPEQVVSYIRREEDPYWEKKYENVFSCDGQ